MRGRRAIFWAFQLLLLLALSSTLYGQLNRGVVEGIVTDPQGAVIPGVEINVTNTETGVTTPATTNNSGYYRAVDLVPGKYLVHFVSPGFAPVDLTGVEVPAGQVIKVDAQLTLGATHQTIEVRAETPLLETAASNFSSTVDTRTVENVPLQGRDIQQLIFLFPGVTNVAGPPGSNFGFSSEFGSFPDPTHAYGSEISVNGGQGGDNAWYLDGNLNLSGFAENVAVNPSPDAVQEFQAITSAFAAEYGRTGGAVFNVVLKSGTNKLHGNIYEYVRNEATNARNPFTSIDAQGKKIKDRQLRFNNFGGTLGGPVVIPHLYNGKNRTFFFFSADYSILHLLGNKVFTVPTALERTGDFSEDPYVVANGLWNPYSTVGPDAQGLFQRTAFGTPVPGNPSGADGCLNSSVEAGAAQGISTCNFSPQVPTNMQDKTAMFFIQSFPLPNYLDPLSGCPMASGGSSRICDNFLGAVGSSLDQQNYSLKIDHQWSDKSKYFGELLFSPGKYNNYRVPWTGATFPNDATGWRSNFPVDIGNTDIGLGNTYTATPTLVNEFRASFTRQFLNSHPNQGYPDSITDQSEVKKVLAPIRIPQDPQMPVPNWGMSMPGGAWINFGPTQWVNMITAAESYNILDNITKVSGKHTFKAGVVYRLEHTVYEGPYPTYFNFGGELAQDPTSGLGGGGFEQFMMGAVATAGRNSATGLQNKPYNRFRYWGFYAQDDFRITPRFTLNLGLRYDLNGLFKIRNHPMANFCLGCPNDVTGLKGKLIYEGDPQLPNGHDIAPANKTSFAPRINFSWTPFADRKTIIRGGFDIFYTNAFAAINAPGQSSNNMSGWAISQSWNSSFYPQCGGVAGECVAWPLSDTSDKAPLTNPPYTGQFPAASRDPLLGASHIEFFTPPPRDPMVQSWGLEVQRELPGNMMISIGYAGTHGTHLMGEAFRQFNYIHTKDLIKYGTAIDGNAPISQFFSGKTADMLAQVYAPLGFTGTDGEGNVTLPLSIMLKDYPFYGAINQLQNQTAFEGTSIYHGMNLRLQKRYAHGLNFIVAYTWSKKITNGATSLPTILVTDPLHWATGQIGGRGGELSGALFGAFQDPDNRKADRAIAADDIPQMLNIAATYELPFGHGKPLLNQKGIVNSVFGGWSLTGNFNAESGVPLPVTCPGNQITNRCNLIGNPSFSGGRSKEQRIADWINPAAYEPAFGNDQTFWANYDPNDPRAYLFGSMGPRMSNLRSPGFWNVDTSLAKDFHLTESRYFQFRWEVFNALNHQNLGLPNTSFCLPVPEGGSPDAVHQEGCTFGRITNVQTDPRSMQFALKFFW